MASTAALAGPPFLTDDPEPVDNGHWEIYGPLIEVEGHGFDYAGEAGVELNYGAAPGLQLSANLPVAFAHDAGRTRAGTGNLSLSVKCRFLHDEAAGLTAAFYPEVTLPTARHGLGNDKLTGFLPLWVQKDSGPWSVFGGGGLALNPGRGNRNYWSGGIAITREVSTRLQLGIEAARQGADTVGGQSSTSLGIGATYRLRGPFRLLASGGPTFEDGAKTAGFHAFVALGMDY